MRYATGWHEEETDARADSAPNHQTGYFETLADSPLIRILVSVLPYEEIFGPHVAVDNAFLMCCRQPFRDLYSVIGRSLWREPAISESSV